MSAPRAVGAPPTAREIVAIERDQRPWGDYEVVDDEAKTK